VIQVSGVRRLRHELSFVFSKGVVRQFHLMMLNSARMQRTPWRCEFFVIRREEPGFGRALLTSYGNVCDTTAWVGLG
jgi:hypothetical protein